MKQDIINTLEKRISKIERTLDKIMNNHLNHIQHYQLYILSLTGLVIAMLVAIFLRTF